MSAFVLYGSPIKRIMTLNLLESVVWVVFFTYKGNSQGEIYMYINSYGSTKTIEFFVLCEIVSSEYILSSYNRLLRPLTAHKVKFVICQYMRWLLVAYKQNICEELLGFTFNSLLNMDIRSKLHFQGIKEKSHLYKSFIWICTSFIFLFPQWHTCLLLISIIESVDFFKIIYYFSF